MSKGIAPPVLSLEGRRALKPLAGRVGSEIEEQRRHARVRQVRGNLRAHYARA